MAANTSWHFPFGAMNWTIFTGGALFGLLGAFLVVVAPVGSTDWWVGLAAFALGGVNVLFTVWRPPRAKDRVTFDDEKVVRTLPNGKVESVRWCDLQRVEIWTTSAGPAVDDVFFMLHGKDRSGCAIPQSALGADVLLRRLQELPGFDNEAVIRAMGSTSDAEFVCWKRAD